MTRKDRTEGIYSRKEVLDESERRQYCLIQLKDLLSYAYRYSEDVKKRFDRAQFNVEKFKTLSDIKHIPILKKKELIFLQSMGPRLGGLLTKDIGDLKRVFLSPGPIFDPEDHGEDYWGYTEAFYSVGFRPGDVVQNTLFPWEYSESHPSTGSFSIASVASSKPSIVSTNTIETPAGRLHSQTPSIPTCRRFPRD